MVRPERIPQEISILPRLFRPSNVYRRSVARYFLILERDGRQTHQHQGLLQESHRTWWTKSLTKVKKAIFGRSRIEHGKARTRRARGG